MGAYVEHGDTCGSLGVGLKKNHSCTRLVAGGVSLPSERTVVRV